MGRYQDGFFTFKASDGDLLEGVEGERVGLGFWAVVDGVGEGSMDRLVPG